MEDNTRDERVGQQENGSAAGNTQPAAGQEPVQPAGEYTQEPVQPAGEYTQEPIQPAGGYTQEPVQPAAGYTQGPGPGAGPKKPPDGKGIVDLLLKNKLIVAIAAAVVVVIIAGCITAAAVSGSPVKTIYSSIKDTRKEIEEGTLLETLNDVLDGGSIEVSLNTDGVTRGYLDMDVRAKLYPHLEDNAYALYANASMDGSDLFDATFWLDEKDIIARSDILLDETYGISLKNLEKNLEDSALLEVLGIEEEELASLISEDRPELSYEAAEDLDKDLEKLLDKLVKQLAKGVDEYAESEKRKETLDFNGDKTKATVLEITMDGDMLTAIILDMVEYLEGSKDFEKFLDKYVDYIIAYYGDLIGEGRDKKDLVDAVYDALGEVKDADKELEDALEDVEFTLTAYISNSTDCLLGIDFVMEIGKEEVEISVMAGPSLEDLKEFRFSANAGGKRYTAVYTVDENDKNVYTGNLKVREDGKVILEGAVEWDKKDGDFDIITTGSYSRYEYRFSGSMLTKKGVTTIELERVTIAGASYEPDITIILDTSDKEPSKPKYVELLTMDEDDLLDLVDDLTDEMGDLSVLIQ